MNIKLSAGLLLNTILGIFSLELDEIRTIVNQSKSFRHHPLGYRQQVYDCVVPGTFALTFDDGPGEHTMPLLNILKKYNVKATFFVVGVNVDLEQGELLRQIISDGHQLASHTYTHPHLDELTDEEINNEITKTDDAIKKRIGRGVNYFRCPYGECEEKVLTILEKRGLRAINWNFDTKDWSDVPASQLINDYLEKLEHANRKSPGIISLHHDKLNNTVIALPRLIEIIQDRGYQLTTVEECINRRAYHRRSSRY